MIFLRKRGHPAGVFTARCIKQFTEGAMMPIKDVDGQQRSLRYIDFGVQNDKPPLVYLGGTGQTIDTFGPHIRLLSKERRIIVPELRCQGKTDLLSDCCTMAQHILDFEAILKNLDITDKVDVAGFSFGGRVALALASYRPELISRLCVTGVPLHRPQLGKIIMKSWIHTLELNQLEACAWSFILNGYSPAFIEKHHRQVHRFADMIVRSNKADKLINLMVHSNIIGDTEDEYSMHTCAKLIHCPTLVT